VPRLLRAPIVVPVGLPPRTPPPAPPAATPTPPRGDRQQIDALRGVVRRLRAASTRDITLAASTNGTGSRRLAAAPPILAEPHLPGTDAPLPRREPLGAPPRPMVLSSAAAGRFPTAERAELTRLGLDLELSPLPELLERASAELADLLDDELRRPPKWVGVVGDTVQPLPGATAAEATPQAAVPTTMGTVKPVGISELLLVRHQLLGYEPGEIAYVENVLAGERRSREHRRTRTTDETVDVESEVSREEEKDTQTVERFELEREVAAVQRDDARLEAGVSVSGSYGPAIEFTADTAGEMSRSRELTTRTASTYSKEVTARAATRIVERRRERRTVRSIDTTVERNKHAFENSSGTAHITGTYQFLNKVIEAQVFSYGKRLLFDVMVPEPAALLLHRLLDPDPTSSIPEPPAFDLAIADIEPETYLAYVARYGATGVPAPPSPFLTVAKTFDGVVTKDEEGATRAAEVTLPDGYAAMTANVSGSMSWFDRKDDEFEFYVLVGGERWTRTPAGGDESSFTLSDQVGAVAIGVRTKHLDHWVVNIEIACGATTELMDSWRLEAFAALEEAHLRQQDEFEQAVAAQQEAGAGRFDVGLPGQARRLERDEIKRLAIVALTGQQFELFGAVTTAADGLPAVALDEADAEGRYVRFFEQAFEWDRMSYRLLPYFWGRRSTWLDRLSLEDTDPDLVDFLRAGSARALVSVRPGFEDVVLHFLDTGDVWDGGEPPQVTSEDYVALADEIAEVEGRPSDDERPMGRPWLVRVPTPLVRLRIEDDLPTWEGSGALAER
jgi:hypothetical protein